MVNVESKQQDYKGSSFFVLSTRMLKYCTGEINGDSIDGH